MKRSKVILSLTTCVLAIAAFAASKARTSNQICVTTGNTHNQHTFQKACTASQGQGAATCTTLVGSSHKTVLTAGCNAKAWFGGA